MKHSKQSHDLVRQNENTVKQSHKHDANLQKNSTLYFQVGLIVCLLTALGLLEMRFETKEAYVSEVVEPIEDDRFEIAQEKYKVYVEPEQKQEIKKQEQEIKKFIDKYEEVDNTTKLPEDVNIETPDSATPDVSFDLNSVDVPTIDVEPVVEFINVEQVPIYPGCERYKDENKALRKCMSDKINKLVQKKFNGGIASDYGLSGRQRIFVEFQIDKAGKVTDIKSRAPHPKLEDEAERVINKIPEMQPGMQRDKPVGVRYTLPITFMVE